MNAGQNSVLAGSLHGFFNQYLPQQRAMSPHTRHSYRDSLKLLLRFVSGSNGDPSTIRVQDLNAERILAFLQDLETRRKNQPATRNVRLSAIHSFFRYLAGQHPEHLEQAQQVLALPFKRTVSREVQHLDSEEIQGVLRAIDRSTGPGQRDFALLSLLFNTGARVSEIVGLKASDLRLTPPPSVRLRGKGGKERICPLWPETALLLREYLEELGVHPDLPETLFRNRRGTMLTRFGIRLILAKHVKQAAKTLPALKHKRLHPHSLRHSTAVHLLRSGVDLSTIAHWLGHASVNTTNKYLNLNLEAKREALAKAKPPIKTSRNPGAWKRNTNLISWLESL